MSPLILVSTLPFQKNLDYLMIWKSLHVVPNLFIWPIFFMDYFMTDLIHKVENFPSVMPRNDPTNLRIYFRFCILNGTMSNQSWSFSSLNQNGKTLGPRIFLLNRFSHPLCDIEWANTILGYLIYEKVTMHQLYICVAHGRTVWIDIISVQKIVFGHCIPV